MNILYRPIRQNEVEQYFNLVNTIRDEGKYFFASLRSSMEETYKDVKQHEDKGFPICGVFLDDERLIGWIDCNRGGFDEIAHTANIDMGIHIDFREKGIGRQLLERCIKSAKEGGIEKLELDVLETNQRAYGLYRKTGFVEEGRRIKKRKYNGVYEDIITMGLFLG